MDASKTPAAETPKTVTVPHLELPPSWREIALALSRAEGQTPISKQRALQIHDNAMRKLHKALSKDPVIKEYLKGTRAALNPKKTYG